MAIQNKLLNGMVNSLHAWILRVGQGVQTPLENHKAIEFLINTGLDPKENHKATMTAFNVGPPSAHQQKTFKWCFTDGPMMARL